MELAETAVFLFSLMNSSLTYFLEMRPCSSMNPEPSNKWIFDGHFADFLTIWQIFGHQDFSAASYGGFDDHRVPKRIAVPIADVDRIEDRIPIDYDDMPLEQILDDFPGEAFFNRFLDFLYHVDKKLLKHLGADNPEACVPQIDQEVGGRRVLFPGRGIVGIDQDVRISKESWPRAPGLLYSNRKYQSALNSFCCFLYSDNSTTE